MYKCSSEVSEHTHIHKSFSAGQIDWIYCKENVKRKEKKKKRRKEKKNTVAKQNVFQKWIEHDKTKIWNWKAFFFTSFGLSFFVIIVVVVVWWKISSPCWFREHKCHLLQLNCLRKFVTFSSPFLSCRCLLNFKQFFFLSFTFFISSFFIMISYKRYHIIFQYLEIRVFFSVLFCSLYLSPVFYCLLSCIK